MKIKFIFLLFILAVTFVSVPANAYFPLVNEKEKPYEITHVANDFDRGIQYLGELKGDPQTYEIMIEEAKLLSVSLLQLVGKEILPLSLIVVRENDKGGGVTEIGRISADDIVWQKETPKTLGLTFLKSEELSVFLEAGTYRLEVSTPDNLGKYALVFSDFTLSQGYFQEVKNVRVFQKFFDKSVFSLFKSNYIYLPFGILVLLGAFLYTRRFLKIN